MRPNNSAWLDIVKHRVRAIRAPYLLILQHHDTPGQTRLAAPISLAGHGVSDFVAPRIQIEGTEYRVRLLDMSPVPRSMFTGVAGSIANERGAIMDALDIVLHGYPVGWSARN